jgi:PEGA domain-containing protein
MKFRQLVPALTLTLALASQPVLAQGHRGGGSRGGHGGGGHGGSRGSAVARHPSGRPGYAPRSVAQQRHPRPGTGYGYGYYPGRSYGYRGHGYYPGRSYGYRGHGYYRPYYGYRPYYSYPYYSSYWPGVSLSFGWGYGSSWPYSVGAYYGGPGYSVGVYAPYGAAGGDDSDAPPPPAREAERSYEGRSGRVRLEVRPDDTSVYVDDEFRGTARDTRILNLPPGRHQIELVRPGFAVERREVAVASGESQDVFVELLRP